MFALLDTEYADFLRALEAPPAKGLRINTLKSRPGFVPPFVCDPIPWSARSYYADTLARPGKSWMHEAGLYYLQEPSAMCVATLLDLKPHERVLDLCAAPGGKTTHAACLMRDTGLLVANEIVPARARILAENARRFGLSHTVVTNEHPALLAQKWKGFFDAAIVDAPCSGEGMFRKNDEAGLEWSPESVAACAARQAQILDSAALCVRNGGRIVYSTCTFSREENEDQILAFLNRHRDFELAAAALPGLSPGLDQEGKTARVWPHRSRGEGHFAALLVRTGAAETAKVRIGVPPADRKKLVDFERFAADTLFKKPEGDYVLWGDTLYATHGIPDLAGIKTLMPGLELGTFLKDRFEPAHALALFSRAGETRSVEFTPAQAERFYAGEAILSDAESGWAAAMTDGYTLGWVKVSDGLAKNRLPKGLRRTF